MNWLKAYLNIVLLKT